MLPVSGYIESLYHAAEAYHTLGYSVIPLRGDLNPDRPKVAAVEWGGYQRRRATPAELKSWFVEKAYRAIGIVTGHISGLAVLDLDSTETLAHFRAACPHLADTFTVQTRRGLHYYYHVPPHLTLRSRRLPQADLLWEGHYVVAPPSVINGHGYTVLSAATPLCLTAADLQVLNAFLDSLLPQQPPPMPADRSVRPYLAASQAVALYRSLVEQGGRNNALFYTSLRARDSGWSPAQAIDTLADLHARQPASDETRHEPYGQRYDEASRTIHSAFSRPPGKTQAREAVSRLPNHLREHLLALSRAQGTAFLRVYEGLLLNGFHPGDCISEPEITRLVKPLGIGRRAVLSALAWQPDAQRLFTPRTPAFADTDTTAERQKNQCSIVQTPKCDRSQKPAHRPPVRYLIPDPDTLCARFQLQTRGGDPLHAADLATPTSYRQALHREFIKRRPNVYSLGLLGHRLGVSPRTIQRYHEAIPIRSLPTYTFFPLSLDTLHIIPRSHYWAKWSDLKYDACSLVDDGGYHYPAHPDLAQALLEQGRAVWLRERGYNFYWHDDNPPGAITRAKLVSAPNPDLNQAVRVYWHSLNQPPVPQQPPLPASAAPATALAATPTAAPPPAAPVSKPNRPSKRRFHHPLPDAPLETLAQTLHAETNPDDGINPHGLSLINARRLVDTYGAPAVRQALNRLRWLREKERLTNPAGFLIVVSRLEWRRLNHATDLGAPAPRFQAEPQRKGRSTYKPPQRDPLWKSVAWRRWRAAFEVEITGDCLSGGYWRDDVVSEWRF